MTKVPFTNKYGAVFFFDTAKAEKREINYVVVVKDNLLLCQYDKISGLYSFPQTSYLSLSETPTFHYTLHTNVEENEKYFKETQIFDVYDVENARIDNGLLSWQLAEDIMVSSIPFDATLSNGFKNLIVRIRK
mgnify:FL=1